MIQNKEDLKLYMEQDRLALHMYKKRPGLFDANWKYQIVLRKLEYYSNKKNRTLVTKALRRFYLFLHLWQSVRYTTYIPPNVCGPGLSIGHMGGVYVHSKARIGNNLRIQMGAVIGGSQSAPDQYPVLGDNVYLGTGAKVLGGVHIADDVAIGANSVVVKDILESGTSHAGVPARKVSDHNSHGYIDARVTGG